MALSQQDRKLPLGKIEPNSAKYFLSCALGGIIGEQEQKQLPLRDRVLYLGFLADYESVRVKQLVVSDEECLWTCSDLLFFSG